MKRASFIGLTLLLAACASGKPERRVETVGEALRRDPDSFKTGVYTNKNGKNLYLVVENLRETQQANERKLSDLARSLDYWQRKNHDASADNDKLRVGITQKTENEAMAETNSPTVLGGAEDALKRAPASSLPKPINHEEAQ